MKRIKRKLTIQTLKEVGRRSVAGLLACAMLASGFPAYGAMQQPVADEGEPAQQQQAVRPPKQVAKGAPAPVRGSSAAGRAVPHRSAQSELPDSIGLSTPLVGPAEVVEDEIDTRGDRVEVTPVDTVNVDVNSRALSDRFPEYAAAAADSLTAGEALLADSLALEAMKKPAQEDEWVRREVEFNPNPTKAVWMSALFPGLGQVYNRRYWKLPIIVGGYLGLAYATNWNNNMLTDYTKAYADLLDNDPDTRSYMDLFAPNVKEENLDKGWLRNVIQSRRNYFRRNRDLCIICMVGVYLIAMVDAYVDASLSHFDISPDLSVDLSPAVMQDGRQRYPSVGLMWALNF